MLAVVPGKRSAAHVEEGVQEFRKRPKEEAIELLPSDDYAPYQGAILRAYGKTVVPPRTGKPGRPKGPYLLPPEDLVYATVHKTRRKGRVGKVESRIVFGTEEELEDAVGALEGQQARQYGLS